VLITADATERKPLDSSMSEKRRCCWLVKIANAAGRGDLLAVVDNIDVDVVGWSDHTHTHPA
jgi:hypothetical protein